MSKKNRKIQPTTVGGGPQSAETQSYRLLQFESPSRDATIAIFVSSAILGLYLGFPEKVFVFDGVLFAGIIERLGPNWRGDLFNRRHVIFNPLMLLLRDCLTRLGIPISAYSLIQIVNALLAVGGALLYSRLIKRLTGSNAMAWLATGLLAVSFTYWSRATEGQVYMLMTFSAILTTLSAVVVAQDGTTKAALLLGGAFVFSVLSHIINISLLPMFLAALWFGWRKTRNRALWIIPLAAAITAGLLFCGLFGIRGPNSLVSYLMYATEYYSPGHQTSLGELLLRFLSSGPSGLSARVVMDCRELASALIASPPMASVLGLSLFALVPVSVFFSWRDLGNRAPIVLLALWCSGYVFIYSFWTGGQFFWAPPLAAVLALIGISAARFWPKEDQKMVIVVGAICVALLGTWNLSKGILPRTHLEENSDFRYSLALRDHTETFSWIIMSGLWRGALKEYVPYFSKRNREVIEYYFNNSTKEQGLAALRKSLAKRISQGVPIYVLPDLVGDSRINDVLRSQWGLSPDEIHSCFGPGHLVQIANDRDFKLFLFIPAPFVNQLFANLLFSALTEADQARLQETVGILRNIAQREMSPAQRRQLPAFLKQTDYGAALLWSGVFQEQEPAARARIEEDLKHFDASQQYPSFRGKLLSIYQFAGVPIDPVSTAKSI